MCVVCVVSLQLAPHVDDLVNHAVDRFVAHYKDRQYLAHYVCPMLLDVIQDTQATLADLSSTRCPHTRSETDTDMDGGGHDGHGPCLCLYSGHDVNLLGLLFALNAVIDDGHWPSYGESDSVYCSRLVHYTPVC